MDSSPRLRLQDIIAATDPQWRVDALGFRNARIMEKMLECGTGDLGYQLFKCDHCGVLDWVPRACQDRNCPSCGASASQKWTDAREAELLPVPYFHIVFTLPEELRALTRANPDPLYSLLMTASRQTLLEFARERKPFGYVPSVIQVLHTWNQRLDHHPHTHLIISGGGLRIEDKKPNKGKDSDAAPPPRWAPSLSSTYLFPVAALSKVFKAKMLAGLRELRKQGKLSFRSAATNDLADKLKWSAFLEKLYDKYWHVYAKRPFGGPKQVIRYLSRYTHRTAISNRRLVKLEKGNVTFSWRDRRHSVTRERTMPVQSFLKLFCEHILPKGFHRIRLGGLIAPNARKKLEQAREAARRAGALLPSDEEKPTLNEARSSRARCTQCGIGTRKVQLTLRYRISWFDLGEIHKLGAIPPPRYEIRDPGRAA